MFVHINNFNSFIILHMNSFINIFYSSPSCFFCVFALFSFSQTVSDALLSWSAVLYSFIFIIFKILRCSTNFPNICQNKRYRSKNEIIHLDRTFQLIKTFPAVSSINKFIHHLFRHHPKIEIKIPRLYQSQCEYWNF